MKQISIELDEETDAALEALAAAERSSKDAVIKRMLGDAVRARSSHDSLDRLVGRYDVEPGVIDEVVYGA